jgi:hypothetical protein
MHLALRLIVPTALYVGLRTRFCSDAGHRSPAVASENSNSFHIDGVVRRRPRWTFHFTPTSASWLNAVEGFFAKLSRRRLKRGVFRSLPELQAAINRFLEETNSEPKPFLWTADPQRVLAAVKRGKEKLESIH